LVVRTRIVCELCRARLLLGIDEARTAPTGAQCGIHQRLKPQEAFVIEDRGGAVPAVRVGPESKRAHGVTLEESCLRALGVELITYRARGGKQLLQRAMLRLLDQLLGREEPCLLKAGDHSIRCTCRRRWLAQSAPDRIVLPAGDRPREEGMP